MSTVLTEIPVGLPEDTRQILSRFFQEIQPDPAGSLDTQENQECALKYAVALLLPRFAGTMLKLLREYPYPFESLYVAAADFQAKEASHPSTRQRLPIALDYLLSAGCAEQVGNRVRVTPFGREVYEARFRSNG